VTKRADEKSLLRLAREGDAAAGELIYERYLLNNTFLRRFLRRQRAGLFSQQDLLHEIYLRLVHHQTEFRGESSLENYIYQIARRTILEIRRRSSAAKRGGTQRIIAPENSVLESLPSSPDTGETELGWIMEKLLEEVPDFYREALRLRLMEDRDYKEISEILDLNLNTVATRIHKGKKILIDLFKKYGIWGRF